MQITDQDLQLIEKYNRPGPRYTSYPPANHFRTDRNLLFGGASRRGGIGGEGSTDRNLTDRNLLFGGASRRGGIGGEGSSPHAPIVPTEEFEGSSQAGPYGDFMVQTDWSSGQLLEALERAGLTENTIVIFTADNGAEHFAYPRALKYDHWSSEPFRGAKRDLYEGGHRVPFVVKWPGVIEAGSVSDALVSQVDIMASLGAVAGIEIAAGSAKDSKNMLPVWTGDVTSVREDLVHNTWEASYAMRQGDWVLINDKSGNNNRGRGKAFEQARAYPADDGLPVELYNLSEDPAQRINLAKQYPEKVQALQALLKRVQDQE